MNYQYSILIQWSNEDQKYIVSLPEFGPYAHTHGNSYEEALKNAQEVLELLIEDYQEQNKPLPKPIHSKIKVEI
jgi:predicted RNase H-like HicB family nuclease